MNLVYWRSKDGNYGDDLNPWLWERLLPSINLNCSADGLSLIGLGSILASWFCKDISKDVTKVVIGTGIGKDDLVDVSGEDWLIYSVRGPLSAACLDLDFDRILADPAVMLPRLWPAAPPTGSVGFMPHIFSTPDWDWKRLCQRAGLVYIDPHGDWRETTDTISGLSSLVTEAMHGAIVADAYRVPWSPVVISPRFDHAKWFDWSGALGLSFRFTNFPRLRASARSTMLSMGRETIRYYLRRSPLRLKPDNWIPEPRTTLHMIDYATSSLEKLSKSQTFYLSAPARLAHAQERLFEATGKFQIDYASGRFHDRAIPRSRV